jgi:hypothetical protein
MMQYVNIALKQCLPATTHSATVTLHVSDNTDITSNTKAAGSICFHIITGKVVPVLKHHAMKAQREKKVNLH